MSKNHVRDPRFVRALELTVPQNSSSNFATNHVKVCAPCMNFSILCEGPDITVIVPRYGIGFGIWVPLRAEIMQNHACLFHMTYARSNCIPIK